MLLTKCNLITNKFFYKHNVSLQHSANFQSFLHFFSRLSSFIASAIEAFECFVWQRYVVTSSYHFARPNSISMGACGARAALNWINSFWQLDVKNSHRITNFSRWLALVCNRALGRSDEISPTLPMLLQAVTYGFARCAEDTESLTMDMDCLLTAVVTQKLFEPAVKAAVTAVNSGIQ